MHYVKEPNEELDAIIESSFDGLYITDGRHYPALKQGFRDISGINGKHPRALRDDIEKQGIVSESVTKLVLKRREPVTIMQYYRTGKIALAQVGIR